ncbi:MAG: Proline--tRNA ligase [Chlamydiae bacterium]|nr:Proline--tRNA ligase [Chlamydiota bacterium]
MRLTNLFFKTFKEAPSDADVPSHKLLEKAGFIKRLARGHYTYTPLMWRVIGKLKKIIREEMEKEGSQEIFLPQLHPKEIWEASGRWDAYKAEKLTYLVQDRDENEYCLGPTHEEAVAHLVKNWITSYKQLPKNLYQITNKFRDEIRPRFGLMRCKEFLMKDAYSLSANTQQMDNEYKKMRRAYQKIFDRLEIDYVIVQADAGKIGGSQSQSEEFQVTAEIGEDTLLVCDDFAFNSEKAPCIISKFEYPSTQEPIEKFETPNVRTIEDLKNFAKSPIEMLIKIIVYKLTHKDSEEIVAVGIRGDREINPIKLTNHFKALDVTLAEEADLKKVGLKKGFIGPVNCPVNFVADNSCKPMVNFICGANEIDFHFKNVNWKTDCEEPIFDDFCQAIDGDLCPLVPEGRYKEKRGIEVGHIFSFGDKYSKALGAFFQNEDGKPQPILMGSFGIGVGRLTQACVEQNYDDKGIIWPKEIAPYSVFLTAVNMKDEDQRAAVEALYQKLLNSKVEVLFDDRKERLGFKLKDSDLVGMPYKIIIGKSYLAEKKLEIEPRVGEKIILSEDELDSFIKEHLLS